MIEVLESNETKMQKLRNQLKEAKWNNNKSNKSGEDKNERNKLLESWSKCLWKLPGFEDMKSFVDPAVTVLNFEYQKPANPDQISQSDYFNQTVSPSALIIYC